MNHNHQLDLKYLSSEQKEKIENYCKNLSHKPNTKDVIRDLFSNDKEVDYQNVYNFLSKIYDEKETERNDAQILLDHLLILKSQDDSNYFKYEKNDSNKLTKLFWANKHM